MDLGAEVLDETIDLIEAGKIQPTPQNHEEASYAPMLTKEHGRIDWNKSAREIKNLIRGTVPWPTSYTAYDGKTMKIWKSSVINSNKDYKPGIILEVKKDCVLVATGKNILSIEELQFSGRKRMSVNQYLIGNNIEANRMLGG